MFLPWNSKENDLHYDDIEKCIEKYEIFKDSIQNAKNNLFPFSAHVQVGGSNERNEFFGGILGDNEGTKQNENCFKDGNKELNFRHPGDF